MKRMTFHTMICGLLAVACAGLFSCADDEAGDKDSQALYVTFRLTASGVPDRPIPTRGTPDDTGGSWGGGYDGSDPVGFEGRILNGGIHVMFYNAADGSYAGRLENILRIGFSSSDLEYVYEFHGELRLDPQPATVEELRQKALKMMVVANMPYFTDGNPSLKAGLSEANALDTLTYAYVGQSEKDFPAIPMWGVCSPDLSAITTGKTLDLGNVSMLRAMAKVEVCVDRENEGLKDVNVKSVTVNKVNSSGYGLPGKWNAIDSTAALTFEETLRVPPGVQAESDKEFGKTDAAADAIVFYLPECENGTDTEEIMMSVTYTVEAEERQGTIHFCPYKEDGQPDDTERWDIVRNHHYRYMISGIGIVKFQVSVDEWGDGGEHNIDMK